MPDVFVSNASLDSVIAEMIVTHLHEQSIDAWMNHANIRAAEPWLFDMGNALDSAHLFVCLISKGWMKSSNCQLELAHAIGLNKRIVPVMLSADLDDSSRENALVDMANRIDTLRKYGQLGNRNLLSLSRDNWKVIQTYNWLFYDEQQDVNEFFNNLVDVIRTDGEYARKHTHYWMNAKKWDATGRKQDFLLTGVELQQAIAWLEYGETKDPQPTELHRQFIRESFQLHQKQSQSIAGRLRNVYRTIFSTGPRKVFLSYRRADSADACGRIYDRLKSSFREKDLFLDVDTIDYGTDFSQFIQDTLTECFVVLAVIGPDWLETLKERESKDEIDFVKIELELSLKRHHINVIPIFVGGASMPNPDELPATLKNLPMMNGKPVRAGRDFHHDMNILIKELKDLRKNARSVD